MFKLKNSKVTSGQVNKIINSTATEENKIIKRLNSLLSRKDIVNLENEKVDAIRMLAFHLESNKEMSSAQLVKFLKN